MRNLALSAVEKVGTIRAPSIPQRMEADLKTAIIIPARFSSSRLPGKPLLRETGKYLIEHVYERAIEVRGISEVLVATDDERIFDAVRGFGGQAVMTREDHLSGTDRVNEAASRTDAEIIINLQGDEPLVNLDAVEMLPRLLEQDTKAVMATVAVPIRSKEPWLDPNCVKVVCDAQGRALYFSRSPIPYCRDGEPDFAAEPPPVWQHLGIYAYRRAFLSHIAQCPLGILELSEKLEQLRALGLGHQIQVGLVEEAGFGIDTPEDYRRFVEHWRNNERNAA